MICRFVAACYPDSVSGGVYLNILVGIEYSCYHRRMAEKPKEKLGYWRIIPDHESDNLAHKELVVRPVHEALTIYFDPSVQPLAREDARFCFVTEWIPNGQIMAGGSAREMLIDFLKAFFISFPIFCFVCWLLS